MTFNQISRSFLSETCIGCTLTNNRGCAYSKRRLAIGTLVAPLDIAAQIIKLMIQVVMDMQHVPKEVKRWMFGLGRTSLQRYPLVSRPLTIISNFRWTLKLFQINGPAFLKKRQAAHYVHTNACLKRLLCEHWVYSYGKWFHVEKCACLMHDHIYGDQLTNKYTESKFKLTRDQWKEMKRHVRSNEESSEVSLSKIQKTQ